MALGKLTDVNLTASATLIGPYWTWLDNLKDDTRYTGAPARCADCRDTAHTQFEMLWSEPRLLSLFAPLFHNLTLGAKYRLTVAATDDAAYAAPVLATGWKFVFPSLYDPITLEWGVENWFSGTVPASERQLYPPHLWAAFAPVLAQRLKIEFDDTANPDGFIDIGGLWTAAGFSAEINFDRGRELAVNARDQLDEAPSGRIFGEERTPRRQMSVTHGMLKTAESYRWVDSALRVRTTRPVIFLPDTDDSAALMREAFPATFSQPPGARLTYPNLNSVAAVLKERLA